MEKKVICFAHEKKTIREFLRKILPFKCEVELMEAVDSSQVVECLNNPKVDAVVVDDGLLTDAHVEILRTAQKPVVVISNNTGKWVGVKVIPKGYTIEQLIKELEAETTESAVSGAQPVVSQAESVQPPLEVSGVSAEPSEPVETAVSAVPAAPAEPAQPTQPAESVESVSQRELAPAEVAESVVPSTPVVSAASVVSSSKNIVSVELIREEVRHAVREILWEILPSIAEEILREELEKILRERLAK
jgi:hypothetical protein